MFNTINEKIKNFLAPKEEVKNQSEVMPFNVLNDLTNDDTINTGFFDTGSNVHNLFFDRDVDFLSKQRDKILKYRQIAMIPDVNDGIDEIINELIFNFGHEKILSIEIDQENDKIKEKINLSFDKIYKIMKLEKNFYNMAKQAYIDGQIVLHTNFDKSKTKGITSVKMIEPCMFGFDSKENVFKYTESRTSTYSNNDFDNTFKYSSDEIIREDFGLYSENLILSYLEYSIKPANMLKTLEDLLVPMRFSRSISRRVFNVDIGDLPTKRGEEVLNEYQKKFKYRNFYNSETGEVSNMQHITSMVEDYWFSNRGGGKGVQVETLDEAGNLGELEDIIYFYKKLYKSMKIPLSRISMDGANEATFDFDSTQTSKEDIKFFMHISRLRQVFISLIKEILKRELIYTGTFSEKEYNDEIEDTIKISFVHDNTFIEKMRLDNLVKKVEIFTSMQEHAGKLMPLEDIMEQVFKMTSSEIEENFKKIEKEEKNPLYKKFYKSEDEGGGF